MRENLKELVLDYLKKSLVPRGVEKIAADLELTGEELKVFWPLIDELLAENLVERYKMRLRSVEPGLLVTGTFSTKFNGHGFVTPRDGGENIFIHAMAVHHALHGDLVRVRLLSDSRRKNREPCGEIVKIIERADTFVVGTYKKVRENGFVIPDYEHKKRHIFVEGKNAKGAVSESKVVVKITAWPEGQKHLEGRIVEILGQGDDPGVGVLSIIRRYRLEEKFPAKVQQVAQMIPQTIPLEECREREDRRYLPIITIDGEDAKDLDDGVYAQKLASGGYRLGVYIADVSWYVRENNVLDHEARERATSIYLADRVIPMLPKELSNGICSLNEGVDRLAMACEMEFTARGRVLGYRIFPTVIRVYRRLTYELVNKILSEKNAEFVADNRDILAHLHTLAELRNILKAKHRRKGALDFDVPEFKINLDEEGNPVGIIKRPTGLAESIIEECMLAANETVAEHLAKNKLPGLYRVHESPTESKMILLNELLSHFGLHIAKSKVGVSPKNIQQMLAKVSGHTEERLVVGATLRSMQQAHYSSKNSGHFGLAVKYYTHFTSPIRRYPDLMVHRLLREDFTPDKREHYEKLLPEVAVHASDRERRATEVERAVLNLKKAQYMQKFIGAEFEAIISGVVNFGFFAELDNGVEGLVHITDLTDDYYAYDGAHFALIGRLSRNRYSLGDELKVIVKEVNVLEGKIDLVPADSAAADQLKLQITVQDPAKNKSQEPVGNKRTNSHHHNKHRGRRKKANEQNRPRRPKKRRRKNRVRKSQGEA